MQFTDFKPKGSRALLLAFLSIISSYILFLPAHAAASAQDNNVFASIRVYDGVNPADMETISHQALTGFLPIISQHEGFIGYYWLSQGDTFVAINLFASEEEASASNDIARDFAAENIAPLLPNPPQIIEGAVDIGVVENLAGMGADEIGSLHASLRIYDEFEPGDPNEFLATVRDGFLPLLRASDGFFGYYLMRDAAGKLATISIFDSEASALASNETARDFVAENLAAYLPSAPAITSERLDIAVLKAVNAGANLIHDLREQQQVFVSLRIFEGVDPANHEAIIEHSADGFLSIMRASDGFVGYYGLTYGDTVAAISLFETAEQAAASNEASREFVAENMADLLPEDPQIFVGQAGLHFVAALEAMQAMQDMSRSIHPRYASVRIYRDVDMARVDEANELAERILLPQFKALDGFFAQHSLHSAEGSTIAISISETRAAADAANEIGKTFTAEHLSDWLPSPPTSFDAVLRVAALAELNMGENLADMAPTAATGVFASIRQYDGLDPAHHAALTQAIGTGFLDIMRASDGFVGYFTLLNDSSLTAVSLFESAQAAAASNEAARDFVAENLASMLPEKPSITEGEVDVYFVQALHGAQADMMAEDVSQLYAEMRVYSGINLENIAELTILGRRVFVPILQENAGFFSQFVLDDGDDSLIALTIYDSPTAAAASSERAAAFVVDYDAARWLPEAPLRIDAEVAVAALAELHMGANLIAD